MTEMSNVPIPAPQNNPVASPTILSSFGPADLGLTGVVTSQLQGPGGTLTYPLDTPKYIMTFTISQYKRNDLNSIGQFVDAGYPGIVMPLPQQLVDTNHVNWAEVEIGTLPGIAVNTVVAGVNNGATSGVGAAQIAGGIAIGAAGAATAVGSTINSALGGPATGLAAGAEAVLGVAPNQFVTLLMKGPTYKRHRFTWTCSPNNFKEAEQLRQIIRTFKNAMSPNFYGLFGQSSPVLWTFPKIFYIRLYPNSKFLYKFKPCVCDYFVVNNMPGGRGAFYRDQNGSDSDGNNPPESVQIQANFIELEYWLENNFSDNNDPDDVNTVQPVGDAQQITDTIGNFLSRKANEINNSVGGVPSATGPAGEFNPF